MRSDRWLTILFVSANFVEKKTFSASFRGRKGADMDSYGIRRNVETFNVLIKNLCKIRKTEDALKVFDRMGDWGC